MITEEELQKTIKTDEKRNKEYLNRFLSDHTMQFVDFNLEMKSSTFFFDTSKKLTLSGATWNILKKCISNKERGIINNPFNLNETTDEYDARLRKQFAKIEEAIILPKNKDFMFLQETDFLRIKSLRNEFIHRLSQHNWGILIPPEEVDNIYCRYVAIIYNKNTLAPKMENKYVKQRPLFKFTRNHPDGSNGYTDYYGYEWEMTHIATKKSLALTSVHLAYTADYSDIIPNYIKEQEAKNIPTIMGGDTNHLAHEIPGAIVGEQLYCTNLGQVEDFGALTLEDKGIKHYDVFVASHRNDSVSPIKINASEPYGKRFIVKNDEFFLTNTKKIAAPEFLAELKKYADLTQNKNLQSWCAHIKSHFFDSRIGFYCIENRITGEEAAKALENLPIENYFVIPKVKPTVGRQYDWVGFIPGDFANDEKLANDLITEFQTNLEASLTPVQKLF